MVGSTRWQSALIDIPKASVFSGLNVNLFRGRYSVALTMPWAPTSAPMPQSIKRCPVLISCGHDPTLFWASGNELRFGLSEYDYAGGHRRLPSV